MEQLETLRLDSEPYPIDYEPLYPGHLLVIIFFAYLLLFLILVGVTNYRQTMYATIRH